MARDFAMVVYSDESTSLRSKPTTAVPMFASASTSFRGTWRTRCLSHTNHGPQQCSPPSRDQAMYFLPSQLGDAGSSTNEFNQCVFIRYYAIRLRKRWAMFFQTKLMRAGAGPHDLGSGDNKGDAHPELAVQSDAEPTTSGDDHLGGQWDPIDDGSGSGPHIVVRNTPHVSSRHSF
ncbi:hypothetical protein BDM02DRAFT_874737 [Thelephora ganbajun]|uniref:Uncharacterized protein n=1 Tax=Thelephora ganbajun TaxID=370292 RepID=A0ACB6Z4R2_THEGA|nr:hypothetical protein BDM02DRAFT_874737 [Thelephora ganbajun]